MKIKPKYTGSNVPQSKFTKFIQCSNYVRINGRLVEQRTPFGWVIFYDPYDEYRKTFTSPIYSIEQCIKIVKRRIKKLRRLGVL